ncbi:MAG: amino acid adenylation domain-containing protein [Polaribacter sp.]|jgi:amino acid adenylation domain-containing protein
MDKKARIAELLKKRGVKTQAHQSIKQLNSAEPVELSFSQQRLWYLDQLIPEQSVYNLPAAFQIDGELDKLRLNDSFNRVIQRHQSLRTQFKIINGKPMQSIVSKLILEMKFVEKSNLSGGNVDDYLRGLASEPFSLFGEPLIRASLIQISENKNILFLMTHHIISDGTSMTNLINEIGKNYLENRKDSSCEIVDELIQYADYSEWQNNYLSGDELERQLKYWKDKFSGELPTLNLNTDFVRPAIQSFSGVTLDFELQVNLSSQIEALAKSCHSTTYTVLLTALYILISRYTDQTDIVIGTLIRNRENPQLESSIGYFANTLAIRSQLNPKASIQQTLHSIGNEVLGAHENQSLPFEKLVAELNMERDLSRTPLFQILMGFQQISRRNLVVDNLTFSHKQVAMNSSKTDIAFFFSQNDSQIVLEMTYATSLYKKQTLLQMFDNLKVILASMVSAKEQILEDLDSRSDWDKKVCRQGIEQEEPLKSDHMLKRFQLSVEEYSNKTAIRFLGKDTTYLALEIQSNQLAYYLIEQGIVPGELVGISTSRSSSTLVAILATFKVGAAYLPLDPEFPDERLAFMVSDSSVKHILTESKIAFADSDSTDEKFSNAKLHCLDLIHIQLKSLNRTAINRPYSGLELAYVIYTSGSTGKPKGVEIQHAALAHFLQNMAIKPGIVAEDKVLSITTFSFDISILEMLLPLSYGATCVVADESAAVDSKILIELLETEKVTLMQATPSLWQILIMSQWKGNHRIKALTGGEALSKDLASQLKPLVGSLWNMYGPTETTIWSSCYEVITPEDDIYIGKAIGNTQLFCLDSGLRPTPVNVPGELYIGGAGLAKGYLNRASLTQERFIENIKIEDNNPRLYRTGDKVKFCADGNLEYLGRLDSQVKLRGHRIELGEIESSLASFSSIKQSVACVFKRSENDARLVAFYVLKANELSPTNTELRLYLNNYLPDYMLPQFFVPLTQLPMTANGKVDRNALIDPQALNTSTDDDFIEPTTPQEVLLAEIWQQVLSDDKPRSISDNFFNVGGHSMLAVVVIGKIENVTGIRISPMLMATGNLSQLAKEIESKQLQKKVVSSKVGTVSSFINRIFNFSK